jgi:hypothetical protein
MAKVSGWFGHLWVIPPDGVEQAQWLHNNDILLEHACWNQLFIGRTARGHKKASVLLVFSVFS